MKKRQVSKRQRTAYGFLSMAVAFFAVGLGTDGARLVWFVLAGMFVLFGGQMLRDGNPPDGQPGNGREDRAS